MAETSTKPYLIRAIYEWCNDNGYTPYMAVEVDERAKVPLEYVKDGEIVLNVSPVATHGLVIGNDLITFQARFGGVSRQLSIPVDTVSAIYARESGHGMAFDVVKAPGANAAADDAVPAPEVPYGAPARAPGARGRSGKKPVAIAPVPAPAAVEAGTEAPSAPEGPADGAPRAGRGHLKRVK